MFLYVWSIGFLFCLFCFPDYTNCAKDVVKIGAIFDTEDDSLEIAFNNAIEMINLDEKILPSTVLEPHIERLVTDRQSSLHIQQKVCSLINSSVVVIFGPSSPYTASMSQSICDTLEIPHIDTQYGSERTSLDFQISIYPHQDTLSQAYLEVLTAMNWKSFTIIYDDESSLFRNQNIIQRYTGVQSYSILIRQLPRSSHLIPFLLQLKRENHKSFLVDININIVKHFLHLAHDVAMLTDEYSFFFTSLDLQTVKLKRFAVTDVNIMGMSLVDFTSDEIQDVISDWTRNGTHMTVHTDMALLYDSVHLFAKSLNDFISIGPFDAVPVLSCDEDKTWKHGLSLVNFIKMETDHGLTGHIQLDNKGLRTHLSLNTIKLTEDGFKNTGVWSTTSQFSPLVSRVADFTEHEDTQNGQTLIMTTLINVPYVQRKQSETETDDSLDEYEGYVIDLVREIAKLWNFTIKVQLAADGRYGAFDEASQTWNGMIGEVRNETADFAALDLTITIDREKAVDFTVPFMTTGIGLLYVSEVYSEGPNLFAFLLPFSHELWLYVGVSFLAISLALFVTGRLNSSFQKYEENTFSLRNSLWFTLSSLLHRKYYVAPKAISTRTVAVTWWFVSLVFVYAYMSHLVSYMTVGMATPSQIQDHTDLAEQETVQFGVVAGGSTDAFFKKSNDPVNRLLSKKMRLLDMPFSNRAGVDRVAREKGRFAFFMESTSIEYVSQRICNLKQVGGLLDRKGYGIAFRKGSPLTEKFSTAILMMKEDGILDLLKQKWWTVDNMLCTRGDDIEMNSYTGPVVIEHNIFRGPLLVLIAGLIASIIVALCEMMWFSVWAAKERNEPFGTIFREIMSMGLHGRRKLHAAPDVKQAKRKNIDEIEDVTRADVDIEESTTK